MELYPQLLTLSRAQYSQTLIAEKAPQQPVPDKTRKGTSAKTMFEQYPILLPSALTPTEISHHNLQRLAEAEIRLRKAQLSDSLTAVRIGIRRQAYFEGKKTSPNDHGGSKSEKTRMGNARRAARTTTIANQTIYNSTRKALMSMGQKEYLSDWPEMTKEDLQLRGLHNYTQVGGRKTELRWVWRVGHGDNFDPSALERWSLEGPSEYHAGI